MNKAFYKALKFKALMKTNPIVVEELFDLSRKATEFVLIMNVKHKQCAFINEILKVSALNK